MVTRGQAKWHDVVYLALAFGETLAAHYEGHTPSGAGVVTRTVGTGSRLYWPIRRAFRCEADAVNYARGQDLEETNASFDCPGFWADLW